MQDDLIGFVLGALDADEQRSIEQSIAGDVEIRLQYEVLHRAVTPLRDFLRDEWDAPHELAVRTCRLIVESSGRTEPPEPA